MKATAAALFLSAVLALAQTDRVFYFAHTSKSQDLKEIVTAARTIADISELSLDPEHQTLSLHGTGEQIALAEWMLNELDAPHTQSAAVRQFRMENGTENLVRIFYLRNTPTIQDFQELVTSVRTVGDVRRVFTYNSPRAMIARTTPDQMALAAWMVDQLDRPASAKAPSAEYRMPMTADRYGEVVTRVLYASNAQTIQEFQEIATTIRNIANIRRVFTYNRPRAIVVRSDAGAVALAQWLLQRLDQPLSAAAKERSSETYEYDTPYDRDNIIRVFYTPQLATIQDFQQFATRVRTTANLRRVLTYNEPRALAVRGTVDQIATAERMVKELDQTKTDQR